jgi:hypothetical protein
VFGECAEHGTVRAGRATGACAPQGKCVAPWSQRVKTVVDMAHLTLKGAKPGSGRRPELDRELGSQRK